VFEEEEDRMSATKSLPANFDGGNKQKSLASPMAKISEASRRQSVDSNESDGAVEVQPLKHKGGDGGR
jgi:hypothetical protein